MLCYPKVTTKSTTIDHCKYGSIMLFIHLLFCFFDSWFIPHAHWALSIPQFSFPRQIATTRSASLVVPSWTTIAYRHPTFGFHLSGEIPRKDVFRCGPETVDDGLDRRHQVRDIHCAHMEKLPSQHRVEWFSTQSWG